MKKVDYIIVGQGLAGSVLAYQLLENKQTVLVIDEEKENTSSRVAAGLCNPVVFKRLTKSWLVDDVLANAKSFYQQQEKLLGEQFYFDIPIYKLFVDEKEANFWKQKSNEPQLFDWINHKIEHPFNQTYLDHKFGAAKTLQSGYLQTAKWLNHFREFLKKSNCFLSSTFDYSKIDFKKDSVIWNGYEAKQIIFCEGYQSIYNPYFKWLPFKLTKGEVLTVKFETLKLDAAINKGVFILPYNNNYKLGATYNWSDLNEETSQKGKDELIKKATKFIKDNIEVIEHKAGVRPTVSDRRPLIGVHPQYKQLGVFNGLGTKGVMLAPYFAQKLVNCLLNNEQLPEEVNINRFKIV
ncbi:MAG: FAD-dependent oxidoreductase [Flavobacteriales bacterium]|nr:FAD-dependent oxidoreductase [Flavobacteriales bacterium]MCB9364387.1 FAD-dependent oxidoreductase [Flavobacteriales bacterium]